ncbi:hypothetical protein [Chelativorans sp. AA-79]|uniref:hypothetical protein n=1 Tax=Chelativorans sp. AA-79 TaxID=3028735 RepID=UPI0023F956D5|nr:hypothetical protein [Chelativorans sp. AA-79]WEX08538.1 hypothetical protein PVE73_21085 [Chelativorans sp. AA-79]
MLKMSRAELYDLVWSKPLTEVARTFGVRDLHVALACDQYEIARPRAGHWQKLAYGKAVEQPPLENTAFQAGQTVIIDRKRWTIATGSSSGDPDGRRVA